jgi:Ser/Thr protein kinase RdoA (MazF antagonist)
MNRPNPTPFATLSPDCVIAALESLGLRCDGRLLALNSYENRVYQVGQEEGPPLVAKFYRANRWSDAAILEEHAFVQALYEDELPVVPALDWQGRTLHHYQDQRFAVFPTQGGRAPELEDGEVLQRLGRLLGRMHAIGALQPFQQRPALDIASFGEEPRDFLLGHGGFIPAELKAAWRDVMEQALERVRHCFGRAGEPATIRLHGDCYAGNVLWNDNGPHFVDFDDSRNGPAVQDLWMLLSGDRADRSRQLAELLAGYEDFYDFDTAELHLIEALRTLRLIHYSAWLARRWDDPAFPLAFPWFNTARYWQERIQELHEQIALMDQPPLWSAFQPHQGFP